MDAEEERVKPDDGSELEPRPHAVDIYERVCDDTIEELKRPPSSLVFSGLFAGFTIGLAPLAYALALVALGDGDSQKFVATLLYPIGYIAVIIGRAQFFTENTLYPVMVSMRKPGVLRDLVSALGDRLRHQPDRRLAVRDAGDLHRRLRRAGAGEAGRRGRRRHLRARSPRPSGARSSPACCWRWSPGWSRPPSTRSARSW